MRLVNSNGAKCVAWALAWVLPLGSVEARAAKPAGEDRNTKIADEVPQGSYRLIVMDVAPSHDGKSYQARLKLTNRGTEVLRPFGSQIDKNETATAHYLGGDILDHGNWKKIRTGNECIPMAVEVAPGKTRKFLATCLPFREEMGSPLTVRIRWSGLVSEPFTLDWKADRKAGKFVAARKQYIDRLRKLLLKAGFRKNCLQPDDFWEKLIDDLRKTIGSVDGFRPFHADIQLPEIDPVGRIRYFVVSDEISDGKYYYQLTGKYYYQLTINLNPSDLGEGWIRTPNTTDTHVVSLESDVPHAIDPGERKRSSGQN